MGDGDGARTGVETMAGIHGRVRIDVEYVRERRVGIGGSVEYVRKLKIEGRTMGGFSLTAIVECEDALSMICRTQWTLVKE